jgi:hypothetical protein
MHTFSLSFSHTYTHTAVVDFYFELRAMSQHILLTGADKAPVYSLRTLCRALLYCRRLHSTYGTRNALYQGLYMSFCTGLHDDSRKILNKVLLEKLKMTKQLLNQSAKRPGPDFVSVQGFWVPIGREEPQESTGETWIHLCTRVCECVCVCVSEKCIVFMHPCIMCLRYIIVHPYTHTYTHTHTHIHIHTHTHTHTHNRQRHRQGRVRHHCHCGPTPQGFGAHSGVWQPRTAARYALVYVCVCTSV